MIASVLEFEAKVEQRWPGTLTPSPPATTTDITYAEERLDVLFTDELRWFYQHHNGCIGYPIGLNQLRLPTNPKEFIDQLLWVAIGPYEDKHALTTLRSEWEHVRIALDGAHRGELYRFSLDEEPHTGCRAAKSIRELFEAWTEILDADLFTMGPQSMSLVLRGTGYAAEETGPPRTSWAVLQERLPGVNPAVLGGDIERSDWPKFSQRQRADGIRLPIDADPETNRAWGKEFELQYGAIRSWFAR